MVMRSKFSEEPDRKFCQTLGVSNYNLSLETNGQILIRSRGSFSIHFLPAVWLGLDLLLVAGGSFARGVRLHKTDGLAGSNFEEIMSQIEESVGSSQSRVKILKPGSKWRTVQTHFKRKPSKSEDAVGAWQTVVNKASRFFGIATSMDDDLRDKWSTRLKQVYGRGKWLAMKDGSQPEGEFVGLDQLDAGASRVPKAVWTKPKDNVLRIAYDAFKGTPIGSPDIKRRSIPYSALDSYKASNPSEGKRVRQQSFFNQPVSTHQTPGEVEGRKATPAPRKTALVEPARMMATGGMDFPDSGRIDGRKLSELSDTFDRTVGAEDSDSSPLIQADSTPRPPPRDMIDGKMLAELSDTYEREIGTGGFFGRHLLGLKRDTSKIDPETLKSLDEADDLVHRPFFTYWVTFVQVVCYIVTVSVYGLAPIGFHETAVQGEVLSSSLYVESVTYMEKDNFWIGPRQADLIHLGAKYSPCMRKDTNVVKAIEYDRSKENDTACCIRNDGAGCVQTSRSKCSSIMSTWNKRDQGTVCWQDPSFCLEPASIEPYTWPRDIVDWPICTKTTNFTNGGPAHMTCTLAGKPCCIGIQGECMVTTREHCQFLRGYFHEEAFLCSQVSCMSETCGMLPFWNPSRPDQIYRLWISLFIHAGLLQLIISIIFQFLIMRDVEKMMGWFRTAIIYLFSGVVGSLASAIFVPYHVEAGPSGSQFGILSCIFVEVVHNWKYLARPYTALAMLIMILVVLFVIGLLPMIDNYAHLFGFVYGFLLSFSIMPHITFDLSERRKKMAAVFTCFFGSVAILLVLVLLFYVVPIYECPYCQYFSCIPFTENFCDTMEVRIRRTP